jgi:hypothetical protein
MPPLAWNAMRDFGFAPKARFMRGPRHGGRILAMRHTYPEVPIGKATMRPV